MAEAKYQLVLALPMVLTNVFYYLILLVSVMYAGHHGQLQLASSTLANSRATVTGFAFMELHWQPRFTFWVALIMLVIYVSKAQKFEQTWIGLSKESFHFVFINLKLALPSASMVCLEYWAFEILVMLAGLTPHSKTTTSVIAMCVNTENVAYDLTNGLSAVASTRVSNELGAGKVNCAKHAMAVSLKLSFFLAALVLVVLGLGHDTWASCFGGSPDIIEAFTSMTPLLCASIFLDSIQGILSGVSRGCGWQNLVTYINLGTFYLIGMPIASLLAFKFHLYTKGLWFGLICGLIAQSSSLFVVTRLQEWKSLEYSRGIKENSPLL